MTRRKKTSRDSHHTPVHLSHKQHYILLAAGTGVLIWALTMRSSTNPPTSDSGQNSRTAPNLPIAGAGGKALDAGNPNDEKRAMLQKAFEDYAKRLNPAQIAAQTKAATAEAKQSAVQKDGSKIRQLLPPTGRGSPKEDFFGVVEEDVDPAKYLYLHLSLNGADSLITMYERRRSSFFEVVEGTDFWGPLILPNNQNQGLVGKAVSGAGFDSTANDYFNSYSYNPKEQRYHQYDPVTVLPSSVGFWRYDMWQQAVLLEDAGCPWNSSFNFQRIQFYYFSAWQQLGANIYCKSDPQDPSWNYVGYSVMKMSDGPFDPTANSY